MNSVERVKAICKERKIAISKLEKDLGFSNGYIGQLRKGVFPADRLMAISDYLELSVDYLATGEESEKEKPAQESGLSVDEIKEAFRGKSFEELTDILAALTDELKNTK